MNTKRKDLFINLLSIVLMIAAVIMAFVAGYIVRDLRVPDGEFPILRQAFEILNIHGYNDPPPSPALEYGMIRGMLEAYNDPYTSFSEPAQFEISTQNLDGKFGGIGVTLDRDSNNTPVLHPIPDGPAARAGILDGDRLIQVDNLVITSETSTDQIVAAIRGPVGSKTQVVILRLSDNDRLEFDLTREEIPLPSVSSYVDSTDARLGIIKINIIAATTPEEVRKAVEHLTQQDATHFILDLQNNSGGLLDSGIETARLFLKDGLVIEQQYKGQALKSFRVEKPGLFIDIPLVVLINKNTASAAEIIAGSLQAHHRAPLIGYQSFGKDTIQLVFELKDKSSLNVTAAHWLVPGIPKFGGQGLQPDIPLDNLLPGTTGPDPAISAAIQFFFNK